MGDILPGLPSLAEIKAGFDLLRQGIGFAKDAKDLLPSGEKKASAEKSLEEAEKASRLAEVQLAKAMGYELCQCTFPPQIMLRVGDDIQCPSCKRTLSNSVIVVEKDFDPRSY